jgi:hypothetical protein
MNTVELRDAGIALILGEIIGERYNQDETWGVQNHLPEKWNNILMEEVGEASKAALEAYPHTEAIMNKDIALQQWRDEMIQVAAVAIAAIECYDRNKEKGEGQWKTD